MLRGSEGAGGSFPGGQGPSGRGSHLYDKQHVFVAIPQELQDDAFKVPATKQVAKSPLPDEPTHRTRQQNALVFYTSPALPSNYSVMPGDLAL